MTKANCTEIRRELDEMRLEQHLGVQVSSHLQECNECRDFQKKQLKLRQIVGSLGTVPAPPDFDFKLRARLANESARSGFHMSSLFRTSQRPAAMATALVLLIGAVALARYFASRNTPATTVAKNERVAPGPRVTTPEIKPAPEIIVVKEAPSTRTAVTPDVIVKRPTSNKQRSKPALGVQDFALTRAEVVNQQSAGDTETVFPIDASQQSLRVSVFDNKGNAKTISLPPVTFGSQRVVPTASSYAPKGVW